MQPRPNIPLLLNLLIVSLGLFSCWPNAYAALTSVSGKLEDPRPLPLITKQPSGLIVELAADASITAEVAGGEPITFQWWLNGTNLLSSSTSTNLVISSVHWTNAGNYHFVASNLFGAITSAVARLLVSPPNSTNIIVGSTLYSAFRTDLVPGTPVYIDADPAAATRIRATQRSLGYREETYKSVVSQSLAFSPVSPSVSGASVNYDYSAQANKTNLVGFWVAKDVPIIIGPDGLAYISDGHHTTAGYLADKSPPRQWIPGYNRILIGHITANYFNQLTGPKPLDDLWWAARAQENNAFLYGPEGDLLLLPGETNFNRLQAIPPSVVAMPLTPASTGFGSMSNDVYRSLGFGVVDGIVKTGVDAAGEKITGFKKAGFLGPEVFFVEFYWANYFRNRIVWDDSKAGFESGQPNGNAIGAPISFFAAVANAIALARSQDYRDKNNRHLTEYVDTNLFSENVSYWARSSISNGLAKAGDTYHLHLLDDSTILGDIAPSPLSTNILHINSKFGLKVAGNVKNLRQLWINAGGSLKTSWKETTVGNTLLTIAPGSGDVTLAGDITVSSGTVVSNGTLIVDGKLTTESLGVYGGILTGSGHILGEALIQTNGILLSGTNSLTINGDLHLAGKTEFVSSKQKGTIAQGKVLGVNAVRYGGELILNHAGESFVTGDVVKLFEAKVYLGKFQSNQLPSLPAHLRWDEGRLLIDGSLQVITTNHPPIAMADGATTPSGFDLHFFPENFLNNDSDPDGDLLALQSVPTNSQWGGTLRMVPTGVVYHPPQNFEGVDRFFYAVTDNHGGSASSGMEIFVSSGTLPAAKSIVIASLHTGFRLRFLGTPGTYYEIQRSLDLQQWQEIHTAAAPVYRVIEWQDMVTQNLAFYRIVAR